MNRELADIDVIVPVYNGAPYIATALASICAQTHSPRRIIVVDDGSTDATSEIVAAFPSSIPVEYHRKDNGGPNSARNAGLLRSRSVFVAFLDADDEWIETKLEEQLKVFAESNVRKLGVVFCGCCIIDADGRYMRGFPLDRSARGNIFGRLLLENNISGSCSGVLIRRECFETVGFFDENLRVGEDWDMWLRLARSFGYDYADAELVRIRRHRDNAQSDGDYVFTHSLCFYEKWLPEIEQRQGVLREWRVTIISQAIASLPDRGRFLQLRRLSTESREVLFPLTNGSPDLYAVLFFPRILMQLFLVFVRRFVRKLRSSGFWDPI